MLFGFLVYQTFLSMRFEKGHRETYHQKASRLQKLIYKVLNMSFTNQLNLGPTVIKLFSSL